MKKIALISDTHGYIDEQILQNIQSCDEVWHAGDIGSMDVVERLEKIKPLRAVYGNIDNHIIRSEFGKNLLFEIEGLKIFITHIGGYPGKYTPEVRQILKDNDTGLFICGHSHILKVMYDKQHECLHINPGAVGVQGFHKVRTMIRFQVENSHVSELEVIELSKRGGQSA